MQSAFTIDGDIYSVLALGLYMTRQRFAYGENKPDAVIVCLCEYGIKLCRSPPDGKVESTLAAIAVVKPWRGPGRCVIAVITN